MKQTAKCSQRRHDRLPARIKILSFSVSLVALLAVLFYSCSEEILPLAGEQNLKGFALSPGSNLVANPSFETNTTGWMGWQSTISRVSLTGAPNGSYVVKVTRST